MEKLVKINKLVLQSHAALAIVPSLDYSRRVKSSKVLKRKNLSAKGRTMANEPQYTMSEIVRAMRESRGSNPCGIRIEWPRYIRFRPAGIIVAVVLSVAVLLLAVTLSYWIAIALLVPAFLFWRFFAIPAAAFRRGTSNPAVILSVNPFLYAVGADMGNDGDFVPVIRILSGPNPYGQVDVGERVTAAATYEMSPTRGQRYWANVHPILLAIATSDEEAISRAAPLVEQDTMNWDVLEEGLAQVPKPYRPGLYFVNVQPFTGKAQES